METPGGYPKFVSEGWNDNYLPLWLQAAGYNTYYTGKLFNGHTASNYNDPPVNGWNGSDFLLGKSSFAGPISSSDIPFLLSNKRQLTSPQTRTPTATTTPS